MKKQLLAMAVATAISGGAMADINMSGKYKGVLKQATDTTYIQKIDLSIKGTAGKSVVVVNMDLDNVNGTSAPTTGTNALSVSESYIKTKIGVFSINAGDMKGLTGKGLAYKKSGAKTKINAATSLSGIKVKAQQVNGNGHVSIDVSGKVGIADIKVQDITGDNPTISASGEIAGLKGVMEYNDNVTAYSVSADMIGSKVTFVNIDMKDGATATQDDGIFGNIGGSTSVSGLAVSTPMQMGTLTGKYWNATTAGVELSTVKGTLSVGPMSYSASKTEGSDMALDATLKISF